MLQASNLLCNGSLNPLGVDAPVPSLSWRAGGQAAYRILASGSRAGLEAGGGAVWDSGVVRSGDTLNILWGGGALKSAARYWWKVMLWDERGAEGPWSEAAWFETGLLRPADWTARWIHAPKPADTALHDRPSPYFRKAFTLEGPVDQARAYVCGLGYCELYVNGQRAGDAVVDPPFTVFDKTCLYRTYDIGPLLRPGENVIGAVLGNGMYFVAHKNAWDFEKAHWKDNPKLILQADIRLAGGKTVEIRTGGDWRSSTGPIVFDSLYVGERYDARLEMPGWCEPGFDGSAWRAAEICRAPGGVLKSMQMEGVRVVEEFAPASMREVRPGVWVYDMGRSIAGFTRLRVEGPGGAAVTLKHAEKLGPDGDVDDANIACFVEADAFQQDTYTLKGGGVETWQPRFTYHGFQYVRMTGFPGTPGLDALTACVAHTDLKTAGGFACSDDLLNQIQAAARAATTNNWHGMPTDCPHREKNGWTGDALLSSEQALLNFAPLNAYKKWLGDIIDCQRPSGQLPGIAPTGGWGYNWGSGPAWDSVIVLLPWNLYVYTGDASALWQCWEAMEKYIGFMDSMSEDGTLDFGLGDWCPPEGGADRPKAPTALTDTWYYHLDALTAAKAASVLGKPEEAKAYAAHAEDIRAAFLRRFVDEGIAEVAGACQTSYALALLNGIAAGELADRIFSRLTDEVERCGRHIDCGIIGAKYVLQALTERGRADLAYAIAAQRDFPSWGCWIGQGATTLWEMWDGESSRNHHMFSDVSGFFMKVLAGINPDEAAPGFRHILLRPNPVPGLGWAEGWHESHYGVARIRWEKQPGGLRLNISVPQGSAATLALPEGYKTAAVGGSVRSMQGGLRLEAGEYEILAK